jgi:hypothetical protein
MSRRLDRLEVDSSKREGLTILHGVDPVGFRWFELAQVGIECIPEDAACARVQLGGINQVGGPTRVDMGVGVPRSHLSARPGMVEVDVGHEEVFDLLK